MILQLVFGTRWYVVFALVASRIQYRARDKTLDTTALPNYAAVGKDQAREEEPLFYIIFLQLIPSLFYHVIDIFEHHQGLKITGYR